MRPSSCLADSDNDSHTSLLIHLRPLWMTNRERRELRNQDTLKACHDRRPEQQRARMAGPPAATTTTPEAKAKAKAKSMPSQTSSKGSARPAEPAGPAKGKGKKRPADPADPPKCQGKKGDYQKGKEGDDEMGKSKKGSSKGLTRRARPRTCTSARARSKAA